MEDLQNLLEKINRDGVEKAEKEAKRIVDDATTKAAAIVREAQAAADKAKAEAEKASAAYAERATETLRQASRDVLLGLKNSVTDLLDQLLVKDVDKTLADETTATRLVTEAINGLTGTGEIVCGPALAKALSAQLAAQKNFTVVTDNTFGTGFTVKLDNGRVEHAFTGETIATELAKRLRPDLAALLK